MTSAAVVAAGLGSTTFAACATALKHRTASAGHPRAGSRLRQLTRSATRPIWLAALTADAVALCLQVLALHIGTLTVVQPLLISALLFSLLLHHRFERSRPSLRELLLASAVLVSLGGFLAASGTASSSAGQVVQPADRTVAIALGVGAVMAGAALLLAARLHRRANRPMLLGVAVALVYATTAALIKACTNIFAVSPAALLHSWQLYVLAVTGVLGLVLTQMAFRAGPLTASLPAIAGLDPILSVVLGVLVFDEPLRSGVVPSIVQLTALAALAASAFALSRVESVGVKGPGPLPSTGTAQDQDAA